MFGGKRSSGLSRAWTFNGANRDQTTQTVSVCDSDRRNQDVDTMVAPVESYLHASAVR